MVSWAVEDAFSNKHGSTLLVRLRYLFLFAVICGTVSLLLTIVNGNETSRNTYKLPNYIRQTYYAFNNSVDDYTIRTSGCTIPSLQPFHGTIEQSLSKQPKPCKDSDISIISYNKTHIWIERENLHFHGIRHNADLNCCYKAFRRPSAIKDIQSSDVDNRVEYDSCIWFDSLIIVKDEFVKITCTVAGNVIHKSFHLFAIKKPLSGGSKSEKSAYNVIILGIDNVSRLNFHRTMPKTLAYMKEKGGIELLGYNKVGDKSFPNLIAMLLGIKANDLKNMCYLKRLKTFDNCPFVWELFKEAGYFTALGEDSAYLGTFNYGHHGFYGNPTDYYLRTFVHEAERHVGNNRDSKGFICMGDKYSYAVLLDYIEHLTSTLGSAKLFGFFWEVTMSHDHLNYPNVMDEKYEAFLKNLEYSAYLNDTIVIILSDHGIRWGDIHRTSQGRLEERLPMVNILLPPLFQERYYDAYQNLMLNRRRLTTPFDIHATLTDLANLNTVTNENIAARSNSDYNSKSISLFLPIPFNRTCETAAIDYLWCTCHHEFHHSIFSKESQEIADKVIQFMNYLLREHARCATLSLDEILDVIEMTVGSAEKKAEVSWQEYLIVIRTTPGDGIFESILRRKITQGVPDENWEISGTLSRLNMYTSQSHCVNDRNLKLYCYCHDS